MRSVRRISKPSRGVDLRADCVDFPNGRFTCQCRRFHIRKNPPMPRPHVRPGVHFGPPGRAPRVRGGTSPPCEQSSSALGADTRCLGINLWKVAKPEDEVFVTSRENVATPGSGSGDGWDIQRDGVT